MRHKVAKRNFDRPSAHRLLMFRTMVTDLLRHKRIKTTEAKAKEIRPLAERIISLGRNDTVHHRRQVAGYLTDKSIGRELFETIGPKYNERNGGYTRIVKLGPRAGDAAFMAIIELVD